MISAALHERVKIQICILVLIWMNSTLLNAQQLDVSGDVAVIGSISIHHQQDSTSCFIGKNAGLNATVMPRGSNWFIGSETGTQNSGEQNTFVGDSCGHANSSGQQNTFFGAKSGKANAVGNFNTFVGNSAGQRNFAGYKNAFFGLRSGSYTTQGHSNSFFGALSGENNMLGHHNTFMGHQAGWGNFSGNNNTFIGAEANPTVTNLSNATALGYRALVDKSNKVRIGDSLVMVIEGQVPFSSTSDARLKEDIRPVELGLDFVNALNPVIYHRRANKDTDLEMGLIAQDLAGTLDAFGISDLGLVRQNGDDMMKLRYNDMIAPLIKAIQELSEAHKMQDEIIQTLQAEIYRLNMKCDGGQ